MTVPALEWLYEFAEHIPSRETIDFWIIIAAGIGQSIFVVLWGSLPWWREWIGRALMTKAFALMLLIDVAILFEFIDWAYEEQVEFGIHIFVAVGIWLQVYALRRETGAADDGNREVSGTNHPHADRPV